jgi:hypothetical protein
MASSCRAASSADARELGEKMRRALAEPSLLLVFLERKERELLGSRSLVSACPMLTTYRKNKIIVSVQI